MKGISKIFSASIALMKLRGVYSSNQALCSYDGSGTGQGQMVPQTASYVMVPAAPEPIANCYGSQNTSYVPQSYVPQTSVVPPPIPYEPDTPNTPVTPGQEDVGTCTVTMLKHCDSPPEPPQQQSTTTQTVQVPPPQPPTVIVVPPPEQTKTVTPPPPSPPPQPRQQKVVPPPVPSYPVIPGVPSYPMIPGVPSYPGIPGVPMQPGIPGTFSSGSSGRGPCIPFQGGSSTPGTFSSGGSSGGPCTPSQGGSSTPGTFSSGSGSPSTQSAGGSCSCAPQQQQVSPPNPMPVVPTPLGISGNGYPTNNGGYNPNLGQMSSCVDLQRTNPSSQCEAKSNNNQSEKITQYGSEACSAPTPTIVINGSEYLVGPPMYSALSTPQCSNPCPCAA